MKPQEKIALLGGLLDLPILDNEYRYCGIVDDIELEAGQGGLEVTALLVGPGAYRGRLPSWAFRLATWIAGKRMTRVPWNDIEEIGSAAVLKRSADDVGLHVIENRVRKAIPHVGAL